MSKRAVGAQHRFQNHATYLRHGKTSTIPLL